AETEAAMRARPIRRGLAKALEHMGQELGRDADALITNLDPNSGFGLAKANLDDSTVVGELDRIGEQIANDLTKTMRIGVEDAMACLSVETDRQTSPARQQLLLFYRR